MLGMYQGPQFPSFEFSLHFPPSTVLSFLPDFSCAQPTVLVPAGSRTYPLECQPSTEFDSVQSTMTGLQPTNRTVPIVVD